MLTFNYTNSDTDECSLSQLNINNNKTINKSTNIPCQVCIFNIKRIYDLFKELYDFLCSAKLEKQINNDQEEKKNVSDTSISERFEDTPFSSKGNISSRGSNLEGSGCSLYLPFPTSTWGESLEETRVYSTSQIPRGARYSSTWFNSRKSQSKDEIDVLQTRSLKRKVQYEKFQRPNTLLTKTLQKNSLFCPLHRQMAYSKDASSETPRAEIYSYWCTLDSGPEFMRANSYTARLEKHRRKRLQWDFSPTLDIGVHNNLSNSDSYSDEYVNRYYPNKEKATKSPFSSTLQCAKMTYMPITRNEIEVPDCKEAFSQSRSMIYDDTHLSITTSMKNDISNTNIPIYESQYSLVSHQSMGHCSSFTYNSISESKSLSEYCTCEFRTIPQYGKSTESFCEIKKESRKLSKCIATEPCQLPKSFTRLQNNCACDNTRALKKLNTTEICTCGEKKIYIKRDHRLELQNKSTGDSIAKTSIYSLRSSKVPKSFYSDNFKSYKIYFVFVYPYYNNLKLYYQYNIPFNVQKTTKKANESMKTILTKKSSRNTLTNFNITQQKDLSFKTSNKTSFVSSNRIIPTNLAHFLNNTDQYSVISIPAIYTTLKMDIYNKFGAKSKNTSKETVQYSKESVAKLLEKFITLSEEVKEAKKVNNAIRNHSNITLVYFALMNYQNPPFDSQKLTPRLNNMHNIDDTDNESTTSDFFYEEKLDTSTVESKTDSTTDSISLQLHSDVNVFLNFPFYTVYTTCVCHCGKCTVPKLVVTDFKQTNNNENSSYPNTREGRPGPYNFNSKSTPQAICIKCPPAKPEKTDIPYSASDLVNIYCKPQLTVTTKKNCQPEPLTRESKKIEPENSCAYLIIKKPPKIETCTLPDRPFTREGQSGPCGLTDVRCSSCMSKCPQSFTREGRPGPFNSSDSNVTKPSFSCLQSFSHKRHLSPDKNNVPYTRQGNACPCGVKRTNSALCSNRCQKKAGPYNMVEFNYRMNTTYGCSAPSYSKSSDSNQRVLDNSIDENDSYTIQTRSTPLTREIKDDLIRSIEPENCLLTNFSRPCIFFDIASSTHIPVCKDSGIYISAVPQQYTRDGRPGPCVIYATSSSSHLKPQPYILREKSGTSGMTNTLNPCEIVTPISTYSATCIRSITKHFSRSIQYSQEKELTLGSNKDDPKYSSLITTSSSNINETPELGTSTIIEKIKQISEKDARIHTTSIMSPGYSMTIHSSSYKSQLLDPKVVPFNIKPSLGPASHHLPASWSTRSEITVNYVICQSKIQNEIEKAASAYLIENPDSDNKIICPCCGFEYKPENVKKSNTSCHEKASSLFIADTMKPKSEGTSYNTEPVHCTCQNQKNVPNASSCKTEEKPKMAIDPDSGMVTVVQNLDGSVHALPQVCCRQGSSGQKPNPQISQPPPICKMPVYCPNHGTLTTVAQNEKGSVHAMVKCTPKAQTTSNTNPASCMVKMPPPCQPSPCQPPPCQPPPDVSGICPRCKMEEGLQNVVSPDNSSLSNQSDTCCPPTVTTELQNLYGSVYSLVPQVQPCCIPQPITCPRAPIPISYVCQAPSDSDESPVCKREESNTYSPKDQIECGPKAPKTCSLPCANIAVISALSPGVYAVSTECNKPTKPSKESFCDRCNPPPPEVSCKGSKKSIAKKQGKSGVLQAEYKEITKIIRYKNPDGTITDEKQTITIKTERKHPPSDGATLSACSSVKSLPKNNPQLCNPPPCNPPPKKTSFVNIDPCCTQSSDTCKNEKCESNIYGTWTAGSHFEITISKVPKADILPDDDVDESPPDDDACVCPDNTTENTSSPPKDSKEQKCCEYKVFLTFGNSYKNNQSNKNTTQKPCGNTIEHECSLPGTKIELVKQECTVLSDQCNLNKKSNKIEPNKTLENKNVECVCPPKTGNKTCDIITKIVKRLGNECKAAEKALNSSSCDYPNVVKSKGGLLAKNTNVALSQNNNNVPVKDCQPIQFTDVNVSSNNTNNLSCLIRGIKDGTVYSCHNIVPCLDKTTNTLPRLTAAIKDIQVPKTIKQDPACIGPLKKNEESQDCVCPGENFETTTEHGKTLDTRKQELVSHRPEQTPHVLSKEKPNEKEMFLNQKCTCPNQIFSSLSVTCKNPKDPECSCPKDLPEKSSESGDGLIGKDKKCVCLNQDKRISVNNITAQIDSFLNKLSETLPKCGQKTKNQNKKEYSCFTDIKGKDTGCTCLKKMPSKVPGNADKLCNAMTDPECNCKLQNGELYTVKKDKSIIPCYISPDLATCTLSQQNSKKNINTCEQNSRVCPNSKSLLNSESKELSKGQVCSEKVVLFSTTPVIKLITNDSKTRSFKECAPLIIPIAKEITAVCRNKKDDTEECCRTKTSGTIIDESECLKYAIAKVFSGPNNTVDANKFDEIYKTDTTCPMAKRPDLPTNSFDIQTSTEDIMIGRRLKLIGFSPKAVLWKITSKGKDKDIPIYCSNDKDKISQCNLTENGLVLQSSVISALRKILHLSKIQKQQVRKKIEKDCDPCSSPGISQSNKITNLDRFDNEVEEDYSCTNYGVGLDETTCKNVCFENNTQTLDSKPCNSVCFENDNPGICSKSSYSKCFEDDISSLPCNFFNPCASETCQAEPKISVSATSDKLKIVCSLEKVPCCVPRNSCHKNIGIGSSASKEKVIAKKLRGKIEHVLLKKPSKRSTHSCTMSSGNSSSNLSRSTDDSTY